MKVWNIQYVYGMVQTKRVVSVIHAKKMENVRKMCIQISEKAHFYDDTSTMTPH